MARIARALAALVALLVPALAAAQDLVGRALTLEQAGYNGQAAALYAAVLRQEPGNAMALLGLERAGSQAGWRDSIRAYAERALAADSGDATAWGVELRALRGAGEDSAAAAVLRRWAAAQPRSAAPYQEWARYSLRQGRGADARDAVMLARRRLDRPAVLAPELAQADVLLGEWASAAAEWRAGVMLDPPLTDGAVFNLRGAPPAERAGVIAALTAPGDAAPAGRRLAANLLLGWDDAARAWALLAGALPPPGPARTDALRLFAERAGELDGPGAQRAAAAAYDALAQSLPPGDAVEARIASARAWAAAGDEAAAGRALRALADAAPDADTRASALGALVDLQVKAGDPAAAARLLAADSAAFGGSQRALLGRRIARGWLRAGAPDSAERAVAGDGSLEADEIRGWVAVYRGALGQGSRLLAEAGAETGDPRSAAHRAATVALLDAVGRDSLPALGAALLLAERGDSVGASRALVAVARTLPADSGEAVPELLAWAARCAASGRDAAGADSLWREIARRFPGAGVAPEAELAVARGLTDRGDLRGAAAALEALILAHPRSALAPEARRELDRVRGLVPAS
jgi:hypothetical protein